MNNLDFQYDSSNPIDKAYIFDYDGNIMHVKTPIILQELQPDGSTSLIEVPIPEYDHNPKYQTDKYSFVQGNPEKSFMHARDFSGSKRHRGVKGFEQDSLTAVHDKEYGSSFFRFMYDGLYQGRPCAINTARGQVPDNIKHTFFEIIKIYFTKDESGQMLGNIRKRYSLKSNMTDGDVLTRYLDRNAYLPVSNIEVRKLLKIPFSVSSAIAKTFATDWYIDTLNTFAKDYQEVDTHHRIKLGFSDDGYENILEMMKFFIQKQQEDTEPYNNFNYRLYYTGKNLNDVEEKISQELIELLGPRHKAIFEQKKSGIITDKDAIEQEYKSLKIML